MGGLQVAVDRLAWTVAGGLGISTGSPVAARTELFVIVLTLSARPASTVTVSSNLENLSRRVCRMSAVAAAVEEVTVVIFLADVTY